MLEFWIICGIIAWAIAFVEDVKRDNGVINIILWVIAMTMFLLMGPLNIISFLENMKIRKENGYEKSNLCGK